MTRGVEHAKKPKPLPKRALSAFMFFSNDIRDTVKREMPHLQFLEISSEIGRRWNVISDEERRPYDELAAAEKKRYAKEQEDYVSEPFEPTPKAPEDAFAAYFLFCKEVRAGVRAENPNKEIMEIAALLAEKWRELPESERLRYQKMHDRAENETKDEIKDSGRGQRNREMINTTPKRPLSAYFFFCNEIRAGVRAENPNKKITEIAALHAEKWRELPEEKRVKYQKMHDEAKINYQSAMERLRYQKMHDEAKINS